MSNGYRVNTDELEATVRQLRALQQDTSQTGTRGKYSTVVGQNELGGDFTECSSLRSTHDQMQTFLAQAISDLDNLINEFGDKTTTVTNAYKGNEDQGKATMNSYQARLS